MMTILKHFCFVITRIIGRLFYHKHIWLLSDRKYQAGDNGEAFFQYLQHKDVGSVFAISKKSKDYERMKQYGSVVDYDSLKYKFLLCVADIHLSSQLIHIGNHTETPHIFLQHGIIVNDMHNMINPACHENFYMVVSGNAEYESLINKPYIIQKENVLLTGLARYDFLKNTRKKKILLFFTWRKRLIDCPDNEFVNSDYYKAISSIYSDERIKRSIVCNGYSFVIKLHPEMQKFTSCFKLPDWAELSTESFNELTCESDLLITDYSSLAFDFFYLKKNVINYTFDSDIFSRDSIYRAEGYYDYKNGIGINVSNYEDFVNAFSECIKNDCKLSTEQNQKIMAFFRYHDKNNCDRIYENALRIINR